MSQKISISVRLEMSVPTFEPIKRESLAAEALGFDAVWFRDHFAIGDHTGTQDSFEAWTTLCAVAGITSTIGLGTLVLCNGWRNPALLAKMGATVDVISNGRLVLGIGAGFNTREFREYGYDFPSNADRVKGTAEAVQIIRKMWTEDRPTFDGQFHSISEATCFPKPIQQPAPKIIVGSSAGEQLSFPRIAKHADGWNASLPIEDYRRRAALMDAACEKVGRDPATLDRLINVHVIPEKDPIKAQARKEALLATPQGQRGIGNRIVVGDGGVIEAKMQEFIAAGANHFIIFFWERERQEDNMAAFADLVFSRFR